MPEQKNSLSPTTIECPVCFAPVGKPCTQATNTGRVVVPWFHFKREDDAMFKQPTPVQVAVKASVEARKPPESCRPREQFHVNPHRNCVLRGAWD